MPVPIWAGRYIGLPFQDHGRDRQGLDCWGLARLVLSEQFGIALPSFAHEYRRTTEIGHISALIEREAKTWISIASGNEEGGDVIVMRIHGKPVHVGLVLGDQHMLHIECGINSVIERYNSLRWKERVFGFYRYKKFRNDPVSYDDTTDDIFGC